MELLCEECGRSFGKRAKLQEHLLIHTGERPFQCDACEKNFRRKSHLSRHISLVHTPETEKPHSCPQCLKSFALKHQLKRHVKKHESKNSIFYNKEVCEVCGEHFGNNEQLRVHQAELHEGEVAYKCHSCDYSTNVKRDYKRHQRRVHAQKLYYCPHCPQHFPTWSFFLSHRSQHQTTAVVEFLCVHCDKSFGLEGKYRKHQQMHEGKWKCGECSKLLSSANALKVHQRTVHLGEKPYVCEKCGYAFAHKHLLARHHRSKCKEDIMMNQSK